MDKNKYYFILIIILIIIIFCIINSGNLSQAPDSQHNEEFSNNNKDTPQIQIASASNIENKLSLEDEESLKKNREIANELAIKTRDITSSTIKISNRIYTIAKKSEQLSKATLDIPQIDPEIIGLSVAEIAKIAAETLELANDASNALMAVEAAIESLPNVEAVQEAFEKATQCELMAKKSLGLAQYEVALILKETLIKIPEIKIELLEVPDNGIQHIFNARDTAGLSSEQVLLKPGENKI